MDFLPMINAPSLFTSYGNSVNMLRDTQSHFSTQISGQEKVDATESFANVLQQAFNSVNDSQLKADELVQTMITNPEQVEIHEVTTALSEAEMSLGMMKSVTDRVISAYRDLTNLR